MEFSLDWSHWIILLLVLIILGACTIEVIYFIRTIITVIVSRYVKKKIHILEKCSVNGICLTRDVDAMLTHMNNSRYLREIDLARIDFYMRTGLYDEVRKNKGQIILVHANCRFRRFIPLFYKFKITTKSLYWNEDSLFLEHRFIGKNNTIHATFLCEQFFMNCNGEEILNGMLGTNSEIKKPEITPEVEAYINLQDISRKALTNPPV